MADEKPTMPDADQSSEDKVTAPNHLEEKGVSTAAPGYPALEKDSGNKDIPDPDSHLSAEEKAAVVSFPRVPHF